MPFKTPKFWSTDSIQSKALWPASKVYQGLLWWDKKSKLKEQYRPDATVVSVGNVIVGGAGKTPLVMILAEHFTAQGEKVAILSRGYGGTIEIAHKVVAQDTPDMVGDEPKSLFEAKVADQIWVGPDRRETAKLAEAEGATLLLLDDGFQHWRLARDLDIVVFNGSFGIGNGKLLPSGPMREPMEGMRRADLAVVMNQPLKKDLGVPTVVAKRRPNPKDIVPLLDKNIVAFCGIGIPEQFISQLSEEDVKIVKTVIFPDHHSYDEKDLHTLLRTASDQRGQLVTTPKDASKLSKDFMKRCHVVRPDFDRADKEILFTQIDKLLQGKART